MTAMRPTDWDLMPYWFRAIEKYMPWIRTVHFVTCGHVPAFLNMDAPKLHHVRHSDFIPAEYLPTFNANTIEMNIHRIPGLSEHFIYFNDDMFVLRPLHETSFFRDGFPATFGGEVPTAFVGEAGIWHHLIVNDLRVINNHFIKKKQIKRHGKKYVCKQYSWKDNIRTRILERLFPECFLGFKNLHAPAAFLKNTLETIWEKEPTLLETTCSHRFRTNDDVNQWLAIWWQIADGCFRPFNTDNVVMGCTQNNVENLCKVICAQNHDMICINDPSDNIPVEILSNKLKMAFNSILPEKSSFEK